MSSGPDANIDFVFLLLDFASIYTKSTLNASIFLLHNASYVPYQRIMHQMFLMHNASTLPTHYVTKISKCTNCYICVNCVVSLRIEATYQRHVHSAIPSI